jgi:hypothetical protein
MKGNSEAVICVMQQNVIVLVVRIVSVLTKSFILSLDAFQLGGRVRAIELQTTRTNWFPS